MLEEINMKEEEEEEEIVAEKEMEIDLTEENKYDNMNVFIRLFTSLII